MPDDSTAGPVAGDRASKHSRRGRWWRWGVLTIAGLLLVGGVALLMALLLAQPASDLVQIERQVRRLKFAGVLVQLLFVVAVGIEWRRIVDWGHRRGFVKSFELAPVRELRWKVVAFLAAFELLVVVGPGEVHRLWTQGL